MTQSNPTANAAPDPAQSGPNAGAAPSRLADLLGRTLDATGDAVLAFETGQTQMPWRFASSGMRAIWDLAPLAATSLALDQVWQHIALRTADPAAQLALVASLLADPRAHESQLHLSDGRVLLQRVAPAQADDRPLMVWTWRDIGVELQTVQQLRAAESELLALLAAFPGYISAIDPEQRFSYVNDRLRPLLSLPGMDLIGQPASSVQEPARMREIEAEMQRAREGRTAVGERTYVDPETGRPLVLQVTHVAGNPRADGGRTVYTFGVDVTAVRQAQEALMRARDEAQRANRAKTEFLSHMSHQLRTPLNAISGFAQLLQAEPVPTMGERQRAWVQEIQHGARQLLALIDEILDLGHAEAGRLRLTLEPVALAPLLQECVGLLQPLASSHRVHLAAAPDTALRVLADRPRLKQVLLNLLGNAIKYNRPGGQVTLACEPLDEMVRVTVGDDGPGIGEDEQQLLFRPFERPSARTSEVEGAGIGLALSQRLMQAMGGRIGVHSRRGEGSRFWIGLPQVAAATPPQTQEPAPAAIDPATVLYIEDNPVNQVLMEAMLRRLPAVQLLSAAAPLEGLEIARRVRPALVLLDIQLPGIDGYEVLARLRADDHTRGIPVIAVSANALPADVEKAMSAGFDGYLTKPLSLDLLLDTMQRALRRPAQPH